MSKINPVSRTSKKVQNFAPEVIPAPHKNFMAGDSWFANPLVTLKMAASSCFFGEAQYYRSATEDPTPAYNPIWESILSVEDNKIAESLKRVSPRSWSKMTPRQVIEKAIDDALEFDPESTLQYAGVLRKEENIRLTPQVILVRAANTRSVKGKAASGSWMGMIRKYAVDILMRTDDATNGLAYQLSAYKGKPIPNSLKRAWAEFLNKRSPYQLAKYRSESNGVKLVDLVNISHPKYSEGLNDLMHGALSLGDEKETWESLISREGSTRKNWEEAIPLMGHMALLRNLRNLVDKGVAPEKFCYKLIDTAVDGHQLPFRYYSAWKAVGSDRSNLVKYAIEESMMKSLGNIPHFSGTVVSLCDNSGSARSSHVSSFSDTAICDIANLSAVITAMRSDNGFVGVFGDRYKEVEINKTKNLMSQVDQINEIGNGIGSGTENGIWLFFDQAIKDKRHVDTVFIYSDMQAGHGGLYGLNVPAEYLWSHYGAPYINVPYMISKYRKLVNPNLTVFMVQVAGYTDTIIPESYENAYILGGWGDGVLRFADEMLTMQKQYAKN